jgi:hypothetical protein
MRKLTSIKEFWLEIIHLQAIQAQNSNHKNNISLMLTKDSRTSKTKFPNSRYLHLSHSQSYKLLNQQLRTQDKRKN